MDIFDELKRMQLEMDRIFKDFFGSSQDFLPSPKNTKELKEISNLRRPALNVYDKGNTIVAEFELPGVDKKDIELNVTDTTMEVKVKRNAEKEIKKKGYYMYESRKEGFYRRVPLPERVIPEKASAEFKNGILKVEAPKEQNKKQNKKRIAVK